MPRRRFLRVLAVVVLAGIAGTVLVLARRHVGSASVSPSQAQAAAVAACSEAGQVQRLVDRNASVPEVQAALTTAVDDSDRAARGDPRWYALAGGLKSLRIALDADDARVARTGIDVVRTECARVSP